MIAPDYGNNGITPVYGHDAPLKLKHSGPGIASFILFFAMAALFVALLIAITVQAVGLVDLKGESMDPEKLASKFEGAPEFAVMSVLLFSTAIGNIIGLILGIVGLMQKERKKLFAILGTVLNGLVVGLLLFFVIIGITIAFGAAG